MFMVYRPLPKMTAEDGNRRQSKFYKFFFLAIILGVLLSGYYLFSLSQENQNLRLKGKTLSYQLGKYAAAYAKSERSLKTARGDIMNFQDSNKQLQATNAQQERDIAARDQQNSEYSLKLDQAYQFFLDVKDMLKGDVNIAEDKTILPDTSIALKTEIQRLQSAHGDFEKLKHTSSETETAFEKLQTTYNELQTRSSELEDHAKELFRSGKMLKQELSDKRQKLEQKSMVIAALQNTIQKLQDDIEKMAKAAAATPAPTPPPTQPPTTTAPVVEIPEKKEPVKDDQIVPVTAKLKQEEEEFAPEEKAVDKSPAADTPKLDEGTSTERRIVEEAHELKKASPSDTTTNPPPPAIESQKVDEKLELAFLNDVKRNERTKEVQGTEIPATDAKREDEPEPDFDEKDTNEDEDEDHAGDDNDSF